MTTWQKAAAAALIGVFGMAWLDQKLLLRDDLALLFKMKGLLALSRNKASYTVTDRWYETLAQVSGLKKCMVNTADGSDLTFGEVEQRSNQIANWAVAQGLEPGQTVALFMDNRPDYIVTWLGLTKAGITIALINSNNKMKPLLHSFDVAHCVAIIFGTELTEAMEGVLPELYAQGIADKVFAVPVAGGPPFPSFAKNLAAEVREPPAKPAPCNASAHCPALLSVLLLRLANSFSRARASRPCGARFS